MPLAHQQQGHLPNYLNLLPHGYFLELAAVEILAHQQRGRVLERRLQAVLQWPDDHAMNRPLYAQVHILLRAVLLSAPIQVALLLWRSGRSHALPGTTEKSMPYTVAPPSQSDPHQVGEVSIGHHRVRLPVD